MMNDSRATAARIVGRWMETGRFADRLVDEVRGDRAFVMEVVHGTVKRKRALEWVARQCGAGRPAPAVRPYLLTGLYEILFLDRVALYAAVNETVEAAKRAAGRRAAGYLNAVLRRAAERPAHWRETLQKQSLGVRESHPDLLVRRWNPLFGAEGTERLCRWNNGRPDVVLHVNRRRTTLPAFCAKLEQAGMPAAAPHPFAPDECLILPRGISVPDVPGYAEGLFSVQDPSTLAAVRLLEARPGERVLDACAAPGGKTVLIADCGLRIADRGRERSKKEGQSADCGLRIADCEKRQPGEREVRIVAMDADEERLERVRENVRRMRLAGVRVVLGDAKRLADLEAAAGSRPFDRILLDVPCTNTGVLRRRPDARWRFSETHLAAAVRAQTEMLDTASRVLRPGGRLVYSTCSLEPEEGAGVVDAWLRRNPSFEKVAEVRTFPPDTHTDGVYAAAAEKRG